MKQISSKYIMAIEAIGVPCSPKQIRREVNIGEDKDKLVSPQNCASALNNLLARGKIFREPNGLYLTEAMRERMIMEKEDKQKSVEPI